MNTVSKAIYILVLILSIESAVYSMDDIFINQKPSSTTENLIKKSDLENLLTSSDQKVLRVNLCFGRADGKYEKILDFYPKQDSNPITKAEIFKKCNLKKDDLSLLLKEKPYTLFVQISTHPVDNPQNKTDAFCLLDENELKENGVL